MTTIKDSTARTRPRALGTPRRVTRYLTLVEYFWLAEQVSPLGAEVVGEPQRSMWCRPQREGVRLLAYRPTRRMSNPSVKAGHIR
jgi:hypothetical protein